MAVAEIALRVAVLLGCGLWAAGLAAVIRPRLGALAALGCCLLGVLACLAILAAGAPPGRLLLPVGLPGMGAVLALDGLSGFFLLVLFAIGAAASMAATAAPDGARRAPFLLGAVALTLLAGDAFTLLLGVAATALAGFALLLAAGEPAARRVARRQLGLAAPALLCLVAALALLAGHGVDFAVIRAHPPAGGRAVAVLFLALLGAGCQAGLAPLHLWLPGATAAAPAPGAALLAGVVPAAALYVLARLLFDLAGPAQPAWFGMPLLAIGVASAVLGGLRATQEDDLKSVLGSAAIGQSGLVTVALGVALAARATDLPAVAALALGGALVQALAASLALALLLLAADAVEAGAGSRRLSRLGGLTRGMPRMTLAVLAGAAGLAALPPGSGFPGLWLTVQALFAAPRPGGLAMQATLVVAAGLTALAVALGAVAAVRLVGVAFLGRPRTPRAAAAQDPPAPLRHAALGLAAASLLVGLLPGPVLALARPALLLGVASGLGGRAGVLAIAADAETPGYAAPGVALLLGSALLVGWLLLRGRGPAGHRIAPAWDGGGEAPPPWLPFGDPLTQVGAAGLAQPLRAMLGDALLAGREGPAAPPGAAQPARVAWRRRDPVTGIVVVPALRGLRALAGRATRVQDVTVRGALGWALATLTALLLAAALR